MPKVLIIEDEPQLLQNLANFLGSFGNEFEVLTALSGEEGLSTMEDEPDLSVLLTDVRLPGIDGIEVVRRTAEQRPEVKIVVMTAFASEELRQVAEREGAITFVEKPIDLERLPAVLRDAHSARQIRSRMVGGLDILEVAQFVVLAGETKVIRFKTVRGEGTVVFQNGVLTHCSTAGYEGSEAFLEMVVWGDGSFCELYGVDLQRYTRNIDVPTAELLDEATRLSEEIGDQLPFSHESLASRISGEAMEEGPVGATVTVDGLLAVTIAPGFDQPKEQCRCASQQMVSLEQQSVHVDTATNSGIAVLETSDPARQQEVGEGPRLEVGREELEDFVEEVATGNRGFAPVLLGNVEISTLLSSICKTGTSWKLSLRSGKQEAVIYVVHGALAHAVLGTTTGEEVLYSVVTWNNVEVELEAGVASPAQSVSPEYATLFLKAFA